MGSNLKPPHYLVVRSPHAELLVLGIKQAEFRSWAKNLAGKTVAIAAAKRASTLDELHEELEVCGASHIETLQAEDLWASKPNGKIIGAVRFHANDELKECDGCMAVVDSWELWHANDRKPSPGGLGLRKIPLD